MQLSDRLPNIELINELGINVKFRDLVKNKLVIINMFYSRCKRKCIPLGKLLDRINKLLDTQITKNDIQFISISIDPTNDTVNDINKYKDLVKSPDTLNWHFYTTKNKANLTLLRYKLGMYSPEPAIDRDISNHSGHFSIFNDNIGFVKHTQSFDNPIDISRKIVQLITTNFYKHDYVADMNSLCYHKLSDSELFENIHSINQTFTVPYLPDHIREKFSKYANDQRGFEYNPFTCTK